jgi:ABC-type transport system substrate-binding protein
MGKRQLYGLGGAMSLLLLIFTSTITVSPVSTADGRWASDFRPYGGYVDEVLLKIFRSVSQAMEALQQGEIDAYDERVLLEYLPAFKSDPNITVSYTPSITFRLLGLNSFRFPTNITGYRRAMAFAMDKYKATEEAVGKLGTPLDSFVPPCLTEWAVEDKLNTSFYDTDFVSGNQSLEAAGFKDLDHDGWREYDKNNNDLWDAGIDLDDNDSRLAINLTATAGYDPAIIACTIAQEGLTQMGIRSTVEEKPWEDLYDSLLEGDYWVICWTEALAPYWLPPQLLFQCFKTDEPINLYSYRFSNTTIDAILDKMYAATTLDDIKKYCREASILLAYELPGIVIYHEIIANAYRTDKFEGYFEYKGQGTVTGFNSYFPTKVRRKESEGGPYGGRFMYGLSHDLIAKNVFNMTFLDPLNVFNYIYDYLFNFDPITWDPIPALAYDWKIEQTTAGGGLQNGQKFTFYLVENATFHDGQPVTSEDVYYSFELMKNHILLSSLLTPVYKFEKLDDHTFVMYVNRTDYYAHTDLCKVWILPWHIWKDVTNLTDFSIIPDFVSTDEYMVGSGPFKWNERVPGKYISLLRHEDWHWAIPHETEPPTSTTSFFSQESTTPIPGIFSMFAVVVIAVSYTRRRRKGT